jgi:hypothetical protein
MRRLLGLVLVVSGCYATGLLTGFVMAHDWSAWPGAFWLVVAIAVGAAGAGMAAADEKEA